MSSRRTHQVTGDRIAQTSQHKPSTAAALSRYSAPPLLAPRSQALVQRKCRECESEALQRSPCTTCGAAPASVPPIVGEVVGRSGTPLPDAQRAHFEARFGFDFSRVRVQADSRAAASARAVGARAYTMGHHIVFGAGEGPGSDGGRLLAHELAHVVQQSRAPGLQRSAISQPGDASEREADAAADAVLAGLPFAVTQARSGVQRQVPEGGSQEAEEAPWTDVVTGERLESFTDRAGAEDRVTRLQEQNPGVEYRIVERGGNFVIQSRAGSGAAGAGGQQPQICGRASTKVAGFPDPHISAIDIDLGNLADGLTIRWSRNTAETRALPSSFPISPGAGLCSTCCDGFAASRRSGSLCTPKGNFTVDRYSCQLSTASWAHNATFFAASIRSGIAIHSGPLPGYPASHGCVRTTVQGSQIIYDNSQITNTAVHVDGTWNGSRCYDNSRQSSARRRDASERCDSTTQAETAPAETRVAAALPEEMDPPDGAGPAA